MLGLVLAVVLHQIPVVGGIVNFVIFLLGVGALVTELYTRRRRIGTTDTEPTESPAD